MKTSKKTLATTITVAIIAGISTAVIASKEHDDLNSASAIQEATLGIDEATKIASKEVAGKVIEAELEHDDGILVWEIEVINDKNQIYEVEIDANSGAILEIEQDDD